MHAADFLRTFSYDHWANRECLRAMRTCGALPHSTLGRLAHILSAEKLWLERLRQQKQSMPVWPTSTIEECQVLADELALAWRDYVKKLSPEGLDRKIEYRNSKGEPWSSRVEDVLMHVLLHSAYHRGQIALEMRTAGEIPAYTDFIHAVRQGLLE
jgi:uncharacterized damage-inducible protein DinB